MDLCHFKIHVFTKQYGSYHWDTWETVRSLQVCVSTGNCTITWWVGLPHVANYVNIDFLETQYSVSQQRTTTTKRLKALLSLFTGCFRIGLSLIWNLRSKSTPFNIKLLRDLMRLQRKQGIWCILICYMKLHLWMQLKTLFSNCSSYTSKFPFSYSQTISHTLFHFFLSLS